MKFVFLCKHQYHWRYCVSLGAELIIAGHDVSIVTQAGIGVTHDADVVVSINRARSERIPKKAVHVSWIQDYRIGDEPPYDENCLPRDIIYTYGEGWIIGVPHQKWKNYRGSMLTAVDARLLAYSAIPQDLDLSIAGYIHQPWQIWPTVNGAYTLSEAYERHIDEALRGSYSPLLGSLNQQAMTEKVAYAMEQACPNIWETLAKDYTGTAIHEYTRCLDRLVVARLILAVSTNVEFRGDNWDLWPEFAPYAGPLYGFDEREQLLRFYQRSRINVHNNVFGFALHDRVLETMAVGQFVMSNASPYHGKAGQMTETFVPDVHYGEYTAETFCDSARYWLSEPERRRCAVVEARKIIKDKHLWSHRAKQLLKDLAA